MKKLYRNGTVHPSHPIKSDDLLLSLLPLSIFSLTAVLSPEDREVLAYLISIASFSNFNNKSRHDSHSPLFYCNCFSCYTSYWVKWDSSPSQQQIHEIIEAFEDSLEIKKKRNRKKDRRKRSRKSSISVSGSSDSEISIPIPIPIPRRLSESSPSLNELVSGGLESVAECCGEEVEEDEKGVMRKFVNFIGEKVFGVWG